MNSIMLFFYMAILAIVNCKSKVVARSAMTELKSMWVSIMQKAAFPSIREAAHAMTPQYFDLSPEEPSNGQESEFTERECLPDVVTFGPKTCSKWTLMSIYKLRKLYDSRYKLWDQNPKKEVVKKSKKGDLSFLTMAFKCHILDVIYYFCTFNYVRDLVFNNTWGIHVCEPKNKNYPEKVVIATVRDIILEGLKNEPASIRKKAFVTLSNAPEYSFASKIWDSIPNCPKYEVEEHVMAADGAWEQTISKLSKMGKTKVEEQFTDKWRRLCLDVINSNKKLNIFEKTDAKNELVQIS